MPDTVPDTSTYHSDTAGNADAAVVITDRDTTTRTYALSSTAALRDDLPADRRVVFSELPDQMILRTGHDIFDALFALAMDETRQNSVSSITNDAFNGGAPVPCECFETGERWTYVWTRDTAYAVHLALALVDPARTRNSLSFKLSERKPGAGAGAGAAGRGGRGDHQIVQDTGSGGSYPVSSDRVVWALGAREVLALLAPTERAPFLALGFEAVVNTIEQDRVMIYDPRDGLYRGEQSFLDWREQSYPSWTREDTSHIAMSKTLSTNVGHHEILRLAADLAAEHGQGTEEARYRGWADDLARAIHGNFWLDDAGQYSTMKTTELDPAALHKYDLLGASLAVLSGIADATQAASVVANYPRSNIGPPVMWPQQPLIPVYHNRGMWPFVTAYSLLAARRAKNAAIIDHDTAAMVRGAALNLSNMENFDFMTGAGWVDDGPYSGPVVNSRRQLWSVAGYLSMVTKVIFGLEVEQAGIRFQPMITRQTHRRFFGDVDRVQLLAVPYRGTLIDVEVLLPGRPAADATGYYTIGDITLDGVAIGAGFIGGAGELGARSTVSITMLDEPTPAGSVQIIADTGDFQQVFAPREPVLHGLWAADGVLNLGFGYDYDNANASDNGDSDRDNGDNGDSEAGVVFNVYRNGQMIASGLSAGVFADPDSGDFATTTYCYAVESEFKSSGHRSHHTAPRCYWGPGNERIQAFDATAFIAVGGSFSTQYGRPHYQGWGAPGDTLEIAGVRPSYTGPYQVQLVYSNGAGPVSTGITAAVKWLVIENQQTGAIVAQGPVTMPQRGDWAVWADSTFLPAPVTLDAAQRYRVLVTDGINMSYFDHFRLYGDHGGGNAPYNQVNITAVKLLAL